jgi:hypothetical protein
MKQQQEEEEKEKRHNIDNTNNISESYQPSAL